MAEWKSGGFEQTTVETAILDSKSTRAAAAGTQVDSAVMRGGQMLGKRRRAGAGEDAGFHAVA